MHRWYCVYYSFTNFAYCLRIIECLSAQHLSRYPATCTSCLPYSTSCSLINEQCTLHYNYQRRLISCYLCSFSVHLYTLIAYLEPLLVLWVGQNSCVIQAPHAFFVLLHIRPQEIHVLCWIRAHNTCMECVQNIMTRAHIYARTAVFSKPRVD